uniref:Pentacotripeptide-repeat region of PRORP domain-containing protein n=1 Tax=Leersia perrieri TaxID=77586 RepID=A0A0D9WQ62_9ORYZ
MAASRHIIGRSASRRRCLHSAPDAHAHPLLAAFSRLSLHGPLRDALALLPGLAAAGLLRVDPVAVCRLVKLCVRHGTPTDGRLIHRYVYDDGGSGAAAAPFGRSLFVSNSLVSMYAKFGLLDDALNLFDAMPQRNVVSWTTVVAALANAGGRKEQALRFFVAMLRDGVTPNMYTFSSVLGACSTPMVLAELHGAIVKSGDGVGAIEIFMRMKEAGFLSNQGTLTSVLRACTGMVSLEVGRQVHAHVLKYDKDLILHNALLDMYCKCGSLQDADALFSRMPEKDVISWSTMISGLAQNGRSIEALKVFDIMKSEGPRPNHITMIGVLFACSHTGLVEDGSYYFRSMEKLFGIQPEREHYNCMVDLLGRAGKLDEAVKFIHEMNFRPDSVIWRTLLGACRMHKNANLAAYAAKEILKLEPDDQGARILLSNTYADLRQWVDAEKSWKVMRDRGVKKDPGRSWIELSKQVHVFIAGDLSHPCSEGSSEVTARSYSMVHIMIHLYDYMVVLRCAWASDCFQKSEGLQGRKGNIFLMLAMQAEQQEE